MIEASSGTAEAIVDHEPLAQLAYPAELAVKEAALRQFWRRHRLPGTPDPILPSPRARSYRTSSKRRVEVRNGRVCLFLGDAPTAGEATASIVSPLEPSEHAQVYRALRQSLGRPAFRSLATHLNYLIIRGSYAERVLVFNVDQLSSAIVRSIKAIVEQNADLPLASHFVYLDPTRSNYYFESRRPDRAVTFKRISGPDELEVSFGERRYRYHPTSFSQVNESMVPVLLTQARELLAPHPGESLLDLYCGYGLFSHDLAPAVRSVVGVDVEGPAIDAARANQRLNPSRTPKRFIAARIDRDFMTRGLHRPAAGEIVLLDPPRSGPQTGVISALGRRRPARVVHVCCDVDQLPIAIEQWRAAGYGVRRVVPLDMFAGAANLEILVLLTADRAARRP